MPELKIEDTVLLLDTSRSMLRKDFKPNRLVVELQTALSFIQTKFSIDMKDRISLLTFGDSIKKLTGFTFEVNKLVDSLNKIQISGKGILHEGIAFALQILVQEMRKIGGKVARIFIITDNKIQFDMNKLDKIVNMAKGLGVYIDACQLGEFQGYRDNTLKRITQLTNGEYGYFNNSKALITAGKAFASKKDVKDTNDHFSPNDKDELAPLLSEIALPLRRPNVLEVRLMMGGDSRSQEKCQICHSIKAPVTGSDFYSEGRYCPSCDRPMHLSCAAMWARKSESLQNIFRCPFCFFLLELPKIALKFVEEKEEPQEIKILDEKTEKETIMVRIPDKDISQINASCSYCHSIFLGDYQVFQCEKCGSYYHQPCLEKMNNEIKACRYCGSHISSI
ncbi:MAG: VWA domain-containing protein [Promethearchaeota archaeon]